MAAMTEAAEVATTLGGMMGPAGEAARMEGADGETTTGAGATLEAAKEGTGGRIATGRPRAVNTGAGDSREAAGGVSGTILERGRPEEGEKKATEGEAVTEAAGKLAEAAGGG